VKEVKMRMLVLVLLSMAYLFLIICTQCTGLFF
jgi:hypothetical protein